LQSVMTRFSFRRFPRLLAFGSDEVLIPGVETVRTYEVSVMVTSSKERLWTVLGDVLRWHEWTPTITRIQPLGPGALEAGRRYRIWQPKLYPSTWTVTAMKPLESFTWESRTPGTRLRADHIICPVGEDMCKVVLRFTFSGTAGWLIGLIFGPLTRRYMALEATCLRQRVEAATSATAIHSTDA
jgi:hypothetical protein